MKSAKIFLSTFGAEEMVTMKVDPKIPWEKLKNMAG